MTGQVLGRLIFAFHAFSSSLSFSRTENVQNPSYHGEHNKTVAGKRGEQKSRKIT